jgi:hypothetical protein
LPARTRKELVDLLQALSEESASQETTEAVHQRALQIVSDICKPNGPQEIEGQGSVQKEGERRRLDRRKK